MEQNRTHVPHPTTVIIVSTIFILVIELTCIELGLRIFSYPYTGCSKVQEVKEYKIGQFDPILGWRYQSNIETTDADGILYAFNEEGYRVRQKEDRTDFTKPRILLLGDSLLFGHGLPFEETVGYKLQKALRDEYQILNFSVQGYGTDQIYLLLQQLIPKYKPALVITNYITDHQNRNINRDRRFLVPCYVFSGTKPIFSLKNGVLYQRHTPETYATYDSLRIRLLFRTMLEKIQSEGDAKTMLTNRLFEAMEHYSKQQGTQMIVIHFQSDEKEQPSITTPLGSMGIFLPYDASLVLADGMHPNAQGASRVVNFILEPVLSTTQE